MDKNPLFTKEILTSIVLRLSPSTKPLKNKALEKIILQILFINKDRSMKVEDIQKYLEDKYKIHFPILEIEYILEELINSKKVTELQQPSNKVYSVSEALINDLEAQENQLKNNYLEVMKSLFGEQIQPYRYLTPFLDFVSIIFLHLGEEYVKYLKGDIQQVNFISQDFFRTQLNDIARKYRDDIESNIFERGINKFFITPDPGYDSIKWIMAQDYYLIRALGLDPTGYVLSENQFRGATLYLDTNILIALIFESDRHHRSVEFLLKQTERLSIKTKILHITKSEFKNWLDYQGDLLIKAYDKIPLEMEKKVESLVFYEYLAFKKEHEKEESIKNFLLNLTSLSNDTLKLFEEVDDPWFDKESESKKTKELAQQLKTHYLSIRNKDKFEKAAVYDALLLQWLDKERKNQQVPNIWAITLDTTLPGALHEGDKALSITLDVLLQWLSPFMGNGTNIQEIFSELIKNRFFPEKQIFDLKDFLIFYELDIRTKNLPAEDVEDAILYLKNEFGEIDPSSSNVMQRIPYELARFFADPSRKYQQTIREYEKNLGEKNKQISEKDKQISDLKERFSQIEKEKLKEKLKASAIKKIWLTILCTAIYESVVFALALRYLPGENWFIKWKDSWLLTSLGGIVFIVLGWFIVGKERLVLLGWPFEKIFKIKEK
jgi:hypothetical protein